MTERKWIPYRERFSIGQRVVGIPGSASLGGRRGTVIDWSTKSEAMCMVKFDDIDGTAPEAVVVSLLEPLGAIDALGELAS